MPTRFNPDEGLRALFKKDLRRRLFVDAKLQGTMMARVAMYWVMSQFMTAVLLFGLKAITGGEHLADEMSQLTRCAIFSTICFLPLAAYDILRLSHRFAGPIVRFRRAMSELGNGRRVEPIRFRDGDYWEDLAASFNAVLKRVEKLHENAAADEEGAADECVLSSR